MRPPRPRLRRAIATLMLVAALGLGATRGHAQATNTILDDILRVDISDAASAALGVIMFPIHALVSLTTAPANAGFKAVFDTKDLAIQALRDTGFVKQYERSVSSTNPNWQDTGIDIPSGAVVAFSASDRVQYKLDSSGRPVYMYPAGGDVAIGSLAPVATPNSMVFKVGDSGIPLSVLFPLVSTTFPFNVLSAYPIPSGGRLYLGMNDCAGCYGDNAGSWSLSMLVTSILPEVFARTPAAAWSNGEVIVPIAGLTAIAVNTSPVTTIDYELNGTAGAFDVTPNPLNPNPPPPYVSVTEDGWHQLRYRARSLDGSSSQWKSMQFGIDTAPPSITVQLSAAPNGANWHTGSVGVSFTCTDAGSGVASCPAGFTASSSVAGTAVAVDQRGNVGTVSYSVNIDGEAPVTSIGPAAALSGWLTADTLLALDAWDAGSGVHQTFWRVNGGPVQPGTQVTIATEGTNAVQFWSVDHAGNVEGTRSVSVRVDRTAPTIAGGTDRAPNGSGWYNAPVSATFQCSDEGSGIAACAPPAVFDSEGAGQARTGTARDHAGNEASTTVSGIHLDLTPPDVTAAPDRAADAGGWYRAPVAVGFTCSDALSGVETCPAAATLGGNGAGQYVSGVARDVAGNEATASATGIHIDMVSPVTGATLSSPANANGWHKADVRVTLAAQDLHSGVARTEFRRGDGAWEPYTAPVPVTDEGVHAIGYRSIDNAGNVELENTVAVRIDTTPPEAFLQFNPLTRDVDLFGRDSAALLSASPASPVSVTPIRQGQVRHYVLTDRAGNTLALSLQVTRAGQNVKGAVFALAYNGQTAAAPVNELHFTATPSRNVQTKLTIGPGGSTASLEASFNAQQNRTVLTENGVTTHLPGMVLFRLTTAGGALAFERP